MHQRSGANVRPSKLVIIAHGGAGDWPSKLHKQGLSGVRIAAARGFPIMFEAGSALAPVQPALVAMEQNPAVNPATASTRNLVRALRTEAALTERKTRR